MKTTVAEKRQEELNWVWKRKLLIMASTITKYVLSCLLYTPMWYADWPIVQQYHSSGAYGGHIRFLCKLSAIFACLPFAQIATTDYGTKETFDGQVSHELRPPYANLASICSIHRVLVDDWYVSQATLLRSALTISDSLQHDSGTTLQSVRLFARLDTR